MSMSLSLPHISTSFLSPPTFQYRHGYAKIFAFWRHRGRERLRPASMVKGPHGFFRVSSCSGFRGERGAAEFERGAEEEEEESNSDEEEVEIETEDNWNFGSCLLPDRWDVLGLGQAMVVTSNFCGVFVFWRKVLNF